MIGIVLASLAVLLLAYLLRRAAHRAGWDTSGSTPLVYADTGRNRLLFTSERFNLTGRPDFILEEDGERFPVERKSRDVGSRGPCDGDRLQLAAYCLLLEEHYGQPVRGGRLEYRNRTVDIDFDEALRTQLLAALTELRARRSAPDLRRSHECAARCRGCGFRRQCTDSLAPTTQT